MWGLRGVQVSGQLDFNEYGQDGKTWRYVRYLVSVVDRAARGLERFCFPFVLVCLILGFYLFIFITLNHFVVRILYALIVVIELQNVYFKMNFYC